MSEKIPFFQNLSFELRRRISRFYRRNSSILLEKDLTLTPPPEIPTKTLESVVFSHGTAENDLEDIMRTFPDDFAMPVHGIPKPILRYEILRRFQVGTSCFVARDKQTNEFLAAIWMGKCNFKVSLPLEKQHLDSWMYNNLYTVPQAQGRGIATALMIYGEQEIRKAGAKHIFNVIFSKRLPSYRSNIKVGFQPIGTAVRGVFRGKRFGSFSPEIALKPGAYPIVPVVVALSVRLDRPSLICAVRALGRKGIPVYVIAKGKMPNLKASKFVKYVETLEGEPTDEQWKERFEEVLKKIGPQKHKPLFMFVTENDLYRFASMQSFLEEQFTTIPSFSEAFRFLEKDDQLPLAEQAGFRVPKSCVLEKSSDLENCAKALQFPIILKPLGRHTTGVFDLKALLVDSAEELSQKATKYLDQPPTVLIAQEYIPGTDNDILVFMGSSDENGDVRVCMTGRKLRQSPPHHGIMACGYIEKIPALEEKSRALCKLYKMRGFVGIECKRPPGTEDYVYIETSFRPETFSALAENAGMNLVFDTYLSAIGEPCMVQRTVEKGSWCNFYHDFESSRQLVKAGEMSWFDYFKRLPRPIAWSLFAWDDPGPFFRWFFDKVFHIFKRKFIRKS